MERDAQVSGTRDACGATTIIFIAAMTELALDDNNISPAAILDKPRPKYIKPAPADNIPAPTRVIELANPIIADVTGANT